MMRRRWDTNRSKNGGGKQRGQPGHCCRPSPDQTSLACKSNSTKTTCTLDNNQQFLLVTANLILISIGFLQLVLNFVSVIRYYLYLTDVACIIQHIDQFMNFLFKFDLFTFQLLDLFR